MKFLYLNITLGALALLFSSCSETKSEESNEIANDQTQAVSDETTDQVETVGSDDAAEALFALSRQLESASSKAEAEDVLRKIDELLSDSEKKKEIFADGRLRSKFKEFSSKVSDAKEKFFADEGENAAGEQDGKGDFIGDLIDLIVDVVEDWLDDNITIGNKKCGTLDISPSDPPKGDACKDVDRIAACVINNCVGDYEPVYCSDLTEEEQKQLPVCAFGNSVCGSPTGICKAKGKDLEAAVVEIEDALADDADDDKAGAVDPGDDDQDGDEGQDDHGDDDDQGSGTAPGGAAPGSGSGGVSL